MTDQTQPSGFAGRMGARSGQTGEGRAAVRFEATDEHLDPAGTLHGGVLAQAPSQGPPRAGER